MATGLQELLIARAQGACEFCKSTASLSAVHVTPFVDNDAAHAVLACDACRGALDSSELDENAWFGLQESAWSEHLPVQVMTWRLLHRINAGWARDLVEQIYLDDEARGWAEQGMSSAGAHAGVEHRDSNGTLLAEGDAVTLIKDLDVKGTSFVAKRGTLVKNIRLTDHPEHIEGKVNGVTIVLKTQFLKKA